MRREEIDTSPDHCNHEDARRHGSAEEHQQEEIGFMIAMLIACMADSPARE